MKMTKSQFMKFVLKYRAVENRIDIAEEAFGIQLGESEVINELYDMIYKLMFYLSNTKNSDNFYDELGKAFYLTDTNLEEFYNKYFEVEGDSK